ncbi:MAG: amidohydrolase family protein [Alphaproteobacteria bacterium]
MSILFSGGAVFDGNGILEQHGVLVEQDRIARVAPLAEFDGYRGERVDTTGGTLLPGLIDCHVHLVLGGEGDPGGVLDKLRPGQVTIRALKHAQQSLAGGITALRDCGGRDYLEFAVRDACNRGDQLGPTIRASGRVICMTGGHGNRMGRIADGVDDVVKAVREQIHAGCDLVKIMATGGVMTPGVDPEDAHYSAAEMAAGIGEAKRFHRTTASHAQGKEGVLNAVRGGVTSIEHGIFIDEKCIAEMLESGTYLVPTLAAVNNIISRPDAVADYVIEKAGRVSETHKQSIKAFYDAGGLIAMGTDAGTPFNHHGENVQELAMMVDIGIPPADVLKTATANGADLMRLADQGRIAEGNCADFLITDGDPTTDITKISDARNHRAVVKHGVFIDQSLVRAS